MLYKLKKIVYENKITVYIRIKPTNVVLKQLLSYELRYI